MTVPPSTESLSLKLCSGEYIDRYGSYQTDTQDSAHGLHEGVCSGSLTAFRVERVVNQTHLYQVLKQT